MGNMNGEVKVLDRKDYLKQVKADLCQLRKLMEGNFESGLVLNGVPLSKVDFQDEEAKRNWKRLIQMFSTDIVEFFYKYEHLAIARRNDMEYGMGGANKELYMDKLPKLVEADAVWIGEQLRSLIGMKEEDYNEMILELGCHFLEEVAQDECWKTSELYWKWFRKKVYEYNCWFRGLPHTAGSATKRYYERELKRHLKLRKIWKSFEYHRNNIF